MTWTVPATRTLVLAGVSVVVVAAAALGGWYWYDRQQSRVAAAYAEVMTRVHAAQSPQASAEAKTRAQQDLERLLAQHPAAGPVAEAALELGNLRFAARQWGPARGAYEVALARGASPTVRVLARASIGYTWEAERDWGKAIDTFQALARDVGPKDFLYEEVQFALARAQEAGGQPAAAVETYQKVLKESPSSPRAEEARQHLMRLGAPEKK
jgi:tetratricopeptide (TPR) repeat protein